MCPVSNVKGELKNVLAKKQPSEDIDDIAWTVFKLQFADILQYRNIQDILCKLSSAMQQYQPNIGSYPLSPAKTNDNEKLIFAKALFRLIVTKDEYDEQSTEHQTFDVQN
ncbi:UNKNOWN [Stylonychia lemnae]|uniref:Uncharacterized protein n=1 Tax=Stylonychia lemnae TaxID=5949 RepID=A0A078B570_STYLE|nr:UNKNOWN [Stylonychia lemnae]|eukprot:CDW89574.1 UNKNOWN [Stylonychia lemnae]